MGIKFGPSVHAAALAALLAGMLSGLPAQAAQPQPRAPGDAAALGHHNVLIADRGNNRLIVVSPQKQILWQYKFKGLRMGHGADDAFFFDGGKKIITSMEYSQVIEIIDVATKKVLWRYGEVGKKGSKNGLLNFPDDAYMLPNGNVLVADIRNCRIIEISPDKQIVRQGGKTGECREHAPYLASPNGDTPLPNGHVLVSTIRDHSLIELDQNWNEVMRIPLTIRYPSDPQPTRAGNFVIADFMKPGRIIEVDHSGKVLWDFMAKGQGGLDRPSLAEELPNGNIIANDDLNHRVIVIDRATNKIVWQYGITGHPGSAPGYLRIPDGLDVLPESAGTAAFRAAETLASAATAGAAASGAAPSMTPVPAAAPAAPMPKPALRKVGAVTRHARHYAGQVVRLTGFLLKRADGYILFSDEPGGRIGRYDLPVTGAGIHQMVPRKRYHIEGRFLSSGLRAANGNPYHLELSAPPRPVSG